MRSIHCITNGLYPLECMIRCPSSRQSRLRPAQRLQCRRYGVIGAEPMNRLDSNVQAVLAFPYNRKASQKQNINYKEPPGQATPFLQKSTCCWLFLRAS